MIRIGMPPIGGPNWMGGYNYQLNLARSVATYGSADLSLVIAFGDDVNPDLLQPFQNIERTTLVKSAAFNQANKNSGLINALVSGIDHRAWALFEKQDVTAIFEPARFFGWRLPVPAVGWIPDFQHRHLPGLFSRHSYWKREFGFRMQIASKRRFILSSLDAEADCIRFYPKTAGRTFVARFAVLNENSIDLHEARGICDALGLPERFFFLPNQMWRHKNHDCVIEALRKLRDQGHDVRIAVTGKEFDSRAPRHAFDLRAKIAAAGLGNQFLMFGIQPYITVQALMACCTAMINPSFFEGWSTTVEEAKCLGVPVILSDIGVHREQAEYAQYFNPHDADSLAECLLAARTLTLSDRISARLFARQETVDRIQGFVNSFRAAFSMEERL
jgi:glycosyltransferase involved in cell wall biosynthesis